MQYWLYLGEIHLDLCCIQLTALPTRKILHRFNRAATHSQVFPSQQWRLVLADHLGLKFVLGFRCSSCKILTPFRRVSMMTHAVSRVLWAPFQEDEKATYRGPVIRNGVCEDGSS